MPGKSVAYTRIGAHRGRKRLWLEGRKLERAGIEPGRRFTITWDPETRMINLDFSGTSGDRVVSKRSRNGRDLPIIDISADAVEEALGEGIERAKVTISQDQIVVEVHPDDMAAQERLGRLMSRIANGQPVLTGSLAHGGGILDHALHTGLKDEGIEARLAFAVEIDEDILDAAATNNPIWDNDTLQIQGGMQEVDVSKLPEIDILVAGLPCTGASKSGKAKNHNALTEDHPEAGALFVSFLRVVEWTNPSICIIENVPDYRTSASASVIRAALTTWGYTIHETILEGSKFGALEDRRRLCFVAVSPELGVKLDELMPTRDKEKTLGEVLEPVSDDSELWKSYTYLIDKAERDAAKGSNFKMNLVGPEAEQVGAIGAGYSKVRQTEPKLRHPKDPSLMRLLTPKEHAAVKTVPAELVEGLGWTLAHTILGNSVTWAAWRSVGRHLGAAAKAGVQITPGLEVTQLDMAALPSLAAETIEFGYDENTPNQMRMF